MYEIGDLLLYGSTGVCRVTDIAMQDLTGKGKGQLYYFLRPLYQDCMISVPVESNKVFLRPIMTREQALDFLGKLTPHAEGQFTSGAARALTEQYEAVLQSHDCARLAELIGALYEKKQALEEQRRRLNSLDERYLKRAEELLSGELAAALGAERKEILAQLQEKLAGEG